MKKLFKSLALALPMVLVLASCQKEKSVLTAPTATAEVKSHSMTISWDAVPNAISYTYSLGQQTPATTKETSVTIDNLKSNTNYTFTIKAVSDGSCIDSEEKQFSFTTKEENISFEITMDEASFEKIDFSYTCTEDVDHLIWYLGSQFTNDADLDAFAGGAVTGEVSGLNGKFSVTAKDGLKAGEPAVVFIRAVSIDGELSQIIGEYVTAGPVFYSPEKVSLGSFVANVKWSNSTDYIGMGFYAFIPEEAEAWGCSTPEELAQMLADWGLIDLVEPGNSTMITLNGQPDVNHCIAIYFFDTNYAVKDIKILNYTSGKVVADAPQATVDVKVENLTSTTADLVFTPSKDACGYVYKLYTKADYESASASAKGFGKDSIEYIRELVDAYGSRNYKAFTDNRTSLEPNKDYILTCFPYNVNGCQGWGKHVIYSFATPAETTEAPATIPASEATKTVIANDTQLAKIAKLLGKID